MQLNTADIGMNRMVPKPSLGLPEFIDWEVISGLFKMDYLFVQILY